MEMLQGNSCIPILNKEKCLFSQKQNRKIKEVLSGGLVPGGGEDIRKGCRRVIMVEILSTHV
jgi:hypothetical protein